MDFWGGQSTKMTLDGEMTDLQAHGRRAEMLLSVSPTASHPLRARTHALRADPRE